MIRRCFRTTYRNNQLYALSIRAWDQGFIYRVVLQHRGENVHSSVCAVVIYSIESFFLRYSKISIRAGIPHSTIHKNMRNKLKMFLLKLTWLQYFRSHDYAALLLLYKHCRIEVSNHIEYLECNIFSDMTVFRLNGVSHMHNARVWGTHNQN